MNSLDNFYLLKHVVECSGFSAASRRLGIAKSTLARRIGELEKQLGMQLYHRNVRRFRLTNFGNDCYQHCLIITAEAEQVFALAERVRNQPAGELHVISPPLFSAAIVNTLAIEFATKVPEVRLHLEVTMDEVDPRKTQADLIIFPSFTPLPDSSVIARKLMDIEYTLVANPRLLTAKTIQAPGDLKAVRCVGLGNRSTHWVWRFNKGKTVAEHRFVPVFTTTTPIALLEAAREGLGVASLPSSLCANDIASGQLVRILEPWTPQSSQLFALYSSSSGLTVAARQFLDLLIERLSGDISLSSF
ncbi:LysR substrate-binding domain-containing protein [Gynuella sunshinyii]|uniref:Transcriptional regulator n=1 Tax=Gynuella sunshinyii YC6258 TaxID=1445510 RepID=A0A0C5VER8_9GAMM|nr:LysR substrate-binding domain-containing protein [Gynuella sunshinyii]AJQ93067.1 transcriptional regulator [Gynuella sunshinyii YC6258]